MGTSIFHGFPCFSPPLLRGVKVSAFSGRYILSSSRCEDGGVLGWCWGGLVGPGLWRVSYKVRVSCGLWVRGVFSSVGQECICFMAKLAVGRAWPAAQTIEVLTFEVDEIILAWCDQGPKALHLSGREHFRGNMQPWTFSSLEVVESV